MQLLSPPRLLPDIDPVSDRIRGWLYKPGPGIGQINLPVDKVWHLRTFSVDDYRPIGDPPLTAALLEIEADMAAAAFNNNQFQKAGMMGVIINVKLPESNDPFGDEELDLVEEMQERIDTQLSGAKAGLGAMVGTGIENVHKINESNKLDMAYNTLKYEAAKTICNCLGVPPEKVAVSRSKTLQYIPSLVEDSVNTAFDKSMNNLLAYVDEFINEKILRERFGITDIRIQSGGRFGALTVNAANAIRILSSAGPIITVNDALEKILGWEPLPADNPRGRLVLDTSPGKKADVMPLSVDPEKEDLNLGKSGKWDVNCFIKWAEMQQGNFEIVDKTYDWDEETTCHRLISNTKGIKYFENKGYRKKAS